MKPRKMRTSRAVLLAFLAIGAISERAWAQSTDVMTHINLVEYDKQTIDSNLQSVEAHMSEAGTAMEATLQNEREELERSLDHARQALELAIGNAVLATSDAQRYQDWAEGRLSDAELAQSQALAEANATYSNALTAERAASDAVHNRGSELGRLEAAASSSSQSSSSAASSAASASSSATSAREQRDTSLSWRNRAQEAFSRASTDASLTSTAKGATDAARTAARQARNAAEQAGNDTQNLAGSAAALRTLLISRAQQAASDAEKIADDVTTASQRYQAMTSLLSTVQGQHDSYLAKLIWAENNIPDFCTPDFTSLMASIENGVRASGTHYSTITARLSFSDNSGAQGQTVNFYSDFGHLSDSSAVTNANGEASVRVTSTAAGTSTVTASYGDEWRSVAVNFVPNACVRHHPGTGTNYYPIGHIFWLETQRTLYNQCAGTRYWRRTEQAQHCMSDLTWRSGATRVRTDTIRNQGDC